MFLYAFQATDGRPDRQTEGQHHRVKLNDNDDDAYVTLCISDELVKHCRRRRLLLNLESTHELRL